MMPPMLRLASTVTVRPVVSVKPNVAMSVLVVDDVEPGMESLSQLPAVDQLPALLMFHEPSAAMARGAVAANARSPRRTRSIG